MQSAAPNAFATSFAQNNTRLFSSSILMVLSIALANNRVTVIMAARSFLWKNLPLSITEPHKKSKEGITTFREGLST